MKKFSFVLFFKSALVTAISLLLVATLIVGIGVVDNANRKAADKAFENVIFLNKDNYILCVRYLGKTFSADLSIIKVLSEPKTVLTVTAIGFLTAVCLAKDKIESLVGL